jgi:putative nucleotidyltransferase with HDIG domain
MPTLPPRDEQLALLREFVSNESLVRHMLAVEAAVRAYARKLGGDEELWGAAALLHDFDYERWPTPPDHPLKGSEILRERLGGAGTDPARDGRSAGSRAIDSPLQRELRDDAR